MAYKRMRDSESDEFESSDDEHSFEVVHVEDEDESSGETDREDPEKKAVHERKCLLVPVLHREKKVK